MSVSDIIHNDTLQNGSKLTKFSVYLDIGLAKLKKIIKWERLIALSAMITAVSILLGFSQNAYSFVNYTDRYTWGGEYKPEVLPVSV